MPSAWEKRKLGIGGHGKRGPNVRTTIEALLPKQNANIYLMKKLMRLVEKGDKEALFKLFDHYFGKPSQAVSFQDSEGNDVPIMPNINVVSSEAAVAVNKLFAEAAAGRNPSRDAEMEVEPEQNPAPESETVSEPTFASLPESDPVEDPVAAPSIEPEPEPEPAPEPEPEPAPKPKPEPAPKPKPRPRKPTKKKAEAPVTDSIKDPVEQKQDDPAPVPEPIDPTKVTIRKKQWSI